MKYTVEKRSDRDGYRVIWFDGEAGKKRRRTRSFALKVDAEMWAKDMQRLSDGGSSPAEVMAAKREAAGTGFALDELVRAGLERMRQAGAANCDAGMTFEEAGRRVHENGERNGARKITLDSYLDVFSVLNATWGKRVAAMIGEEEVQKYLDGLKGYDGPAAQATKSGYLRHIRMAMRCAGVKDPLAGLHVAVKSGEVEFFTTDEARAMLAGCPSWGIGFLSVALFVGIRPENLALLPATAVSVKDRRIRVPGSISKDTYTHLLEENIIPPVLWDWLKRFPYAPVDWPRLRRVLKRIVGRWVHDGLRHTAATYYCSLHGVTATARLLMHEGESLVRRHYAGVIERETALEFYIKPAKIKFRPVEPRSRSKVTWPDDDTLKTMLATTPAVTVAKRFGCSDSALIKHCRSRGIEKPGRGHWTKIAFQQSA